MLAWQQTAPFSYYIPARSYASERRNPSKKPNPHIALSTAPAFGRQFVMTKLLLSKEESFGTDSLTSPPAADRTRASIYSTALTVTEKTGTGWLFNSIPASEPVVARRIIQMSLQMIFSGSEIAQSDGSEVPKVLRHSESYRQAFPVPIRRERGIFAFLLATGIGKVSVVIGAGNLSCPAC